MDKFKNYYKIESTRLQNWDYRWAGSYFITICTKQKVPYFGIIENNEMILSEIGVIANQLWFEIVQHADQVELGAFMVMPDHIHGILTIKKNSSQESEQFRDNACVVSTTTAENDQSIGQKRFQNQGKNSVSSIIGGYKSAVSRQVRAKGFEFYWHSRFYDVLIQDERAMNNFSAYIKNQL